MPDPVPFDDGWGTPSETIHLEAQSESFTALLNIIIKNDGLNKHSEYTWDAIVSVLELGERYGFETLTRLLSPIMHQYAKNHTWEVFRFAAKNCLELLAAYAITEIPNMEGTLVMDHTNINPELFDDNTPKIYRSVHEESGPVPE
jgi:N-acyl-L-homoserine lactone synthetase